jgi:hypothetical protein
VTGAVSILKTWQVIALQPVASMGGQICWSLAWFIARVTHTYRPHHLRPRHGNQILHT